MPPMKVYPFPLSVVCFSVPWYIPLHRGMFLCTVVYSSAPWYVPLYRAQATSEKIVFKGI